MKTQPRFQIRQNKAARQYRHKSLYWGYDRKMGRFVFNLKTWPEVLEWLNGKVAA